MKKCSNLLKYFFEFIKLHFYSFVDSRHSKIFAVNLPQIIFPQFASLLLSSKFSWFHWLRIMSSLNISIIAAALHINLKNQQSTTVLQNLSSGPRPEPVSMQEFTQLIVKTKLLQLSCTVPEDVLWINIYLSGQTNDYRGTR